MIRELKGLTVPFMYCFVYLLVSSLKIPLLHLPLKRLLPPYTRDLTKMNISKLGVQWYVQHNNIYLLSSHLYSTCNELCVSFRVFGCYLN